MSNKMLPGDGWRLLGPEEIIQSGDEVWSFEKEAWNHPQTLLGLTARPFHVRRRLPAKPEAMEIDGHTIINDNGFPRFSNAGNSAYYFSSIPESIRQLADWLTRYADWREAQEGGGK